MTRKLTRITPEINGYAVVIAQKASEDGKPGEYIGCFLQTPESPDDGPLILLADAMRAYLLEAHKPLVAGDTDVRMGHTARSAIEHASMELAQPHTSERESKT